MVLEIRTHPDKGRGGGGWFENPRFWRTSFVDGPFGNFKIYTCNNENEYLCSASVFDGFQLVKGFARLELVRFHLQAKL